MFKFSWDQFQLQGQSNPMFLFTVRDFRLPLANHSRMFERRTLVP